MKTITQAQSLQLLGLLTLAERHNKALTDIHDAVREITGEEDDCGHSSDAVWGNRSHAELLQLLELQVVG